MLAYVNRIITYLVQATICYFGYCLLETTDTLKYIMYDFIPYITAETFMWIGIIVLITAFIWSQVETQLNSVYSFLKRNSNAILGIFVVLEIVTYSKVASNSSLWIGFFILYAFYWLLLHSLFNRTFIYSFRDNTKIASHFTERPVVGTDNLTSPQKMALDCLIKTIDRRDSSDSINIALIGEWGSGKTSITNTLVMELQERDGGEEKLPEYFVLMINTQVIGNTEGIVGYVRKYFSELFRNYGITLFNGDNNVAFLTILIDMLEQAKPISAVKGLIDTGNGNFIDVEQERDVFAKNVRDLLKRSGKKNVLLVIDNIDRIENENQLLLILSEFASINGIISILSLDPKKDSELKDSNTDNDGTNPDELVNFNKLDKYIHARIRIQEVGGIEYNNSVSKQIIEESKKISVDNSCFVQVNGEYSYSLFFKNKSIIVEGDNNLLTKLFFINLEKSNLSFGAYFENLVMDYFCKSEEVSRMIKNANSEDGIPQDPQCNRIKKLWDNDIYNQNPEWSKKLISNVRQMADSIDRLLTLATVLTQERGSEEKKKILRSVFEGKGIAAGVVLDEETYEQCCDSIALVFKEDEVNMIYKDTLDDYYNRTKDVLAEKQKVVSFLLLESIYLFDFIKYIRRCMINYRYFKIQLRECEILNMNYLDYIVNQWKPSVDAQTMIGGIEYMKDLDISKAQPLESIINEMLFEKYIHNYGKNYKLSSRSQLKAHLYKEVGNNEGWINIELKDGDEVKKCRLNVDGTIMSDETK